MKQHYITDISKKMEEQKQAQKQFNEIVSEVLNSGTNPVYKSVVGVVFSLIEDRRLISLDTLLKENYPEYYYE